MLCGRSYSELEDLYTHINDCHHENLDEGINNLWSYGYDNGTTEQPKEISDNDDFFEEDTGNDNIEFDNYEHQNIENLEISRNSIQIEGVLI